MPIYIILVTILAFGQGRAVPSCELPTIRLPFGNCSFPTAKGHVYSTGVLLGAGVSDRFCGMVSTVVNSTLIQTSNVCSSEWLNVTSARVEMTEAQCQSRRGGYVMRDELPEASSDDISTLTNLNPGWVNITKEEVKRPFQYAEEIVLEIKDNTIPMLAGFISQGQQHTMSHIGLAETSTLLQSLKDEGLIGARSWGLDSGSQSIAAPRNGSLVLGGYDASSFDGDWTKFPISGSALVRERYCPLQVLITQINFTVQLGRGKEQTATPVGASNPLTACIEPYDNQFRFPAPYLNTLKGMLGDKESLLNPQQPGLYNIEPGLVYGSSTTRSVSMKFTIASGSSETIVEIPSHELVRPLRGLDTEGRPVVNSSFTEVQVFAEEGLLDTAVLGKVFLSQLYLFIDYENSTFSLAQQNTGGGLTADIKSSGRCPSEPSLTKTDKGLIAVGVVLGVVLFGLGGFLIYRLWMSRLKGREWTRDQGEPDDIDFPPGTPPNRNADSD